MANIVWEKVGFEDSRVHEFLTGATNASDAFRAKINIDKNGNGKTFLRVQRAAGGRYFVRCGFRGNGRSYLSNICEITTIDGRTSLFLFYLEIYARPSFAEAA